MRLKSLLIVIVGILFIHFFVKLTSVDFATKTTVSVLEIPAKIRTFFIGNRIERLDNKIQTLQATSTK